MNARSQVFELGHTKYMLYQRPDSLFGNVAKMSVEGRQIEEVVSCLFHTLLIHRSQGKFHYKQEGHYTIGIVGLEDVDCDFLDLTYLRVASEGINATLQKEVASFRDTLREGTGCGQISMEFYQKKKARWPFTPESIPWEVWTIKLDTLTLENESQRQICREKLSEILSEKVMLVAEAMNRHEYVPKMPNESELDLVFDTSYMDVQPYLFRIQHQTTGPTPTSVGTTMRKFIKDNFALDL